VTGAAPATDIIVVDASVLAAPGLLWYEMSEVARVKCRSHPVDAEAILEQLAEARRLPIVLHSPDWDYLPQIGLDTGLTAYDAAYLLVARDLGVPLATFDRRLGKAAGLLNAAGC